MLHHPSHSIPLLAALPLFISTALASVTCLKAGTNATATWVNAEKKTCTVSGLVGDNFGDTAEDGTTAADYSCNGRCGAGCTGAALGNYYTQDCFSHDLCSYWNDATGGASDDNCGAAYKAAMDDYLLGGVDGCTQQNPTCSAERPTVEPVCV